MSVEALCRSGHPLRDVLDFIVSVIVNMPGRRLSCSDMFPG